MRGRGLTAVLATLLSGVLALSACSSSDGEDESSGSSGGSEQQEEQAGNAGPEDANVSEAQISVAPEDAAENVGINHDVDVSVENGTLDDVTMVATATGAAVDGTLSEDQRSWEPAYQLERATEYRLAVKASDDQGRKAHESATFTTISPQDSFIGYFTPEDGTTVGVGMPVSLNFDKPITNKPEVEEAVEINASSGQEIVGHWFGDSRLDFRPKSYWEANTEVSVELNWDGIEGSPGVEGVQDRSFSFTVGRSQVSTVDASSQQMTVERNGETIRTIPVTTGADDTPTWNGQMVVSEKHVETRMDGATVGFTDDDGNGEYNIPDVPHAMRLSTSGTFIHGNYWGGDAFGNLATSHGCIGLFDVQGANDPSTDGAWFYDNSLLGDVVTVVHSNDDTIAPDNGLNGWNMGWSEWTAGSAL